MWQNNRNSHDLQSQNPRYFQQDEKDYEGQQQQHHAGPSQNIASKFGATSRFWICIGAGLLVAVTAVGLIVGFSTGAISTPGGGGGGGGGGGPGTNLDLDPQEWKECDGINIHSVVPKIGQLGCAPLDMFLERASEYSVSRILDAINPPNSTPGSLLAALSKSCPNYAYTWARDQALVFQVLMDHLEFNDLGASQQATYEQVLKDYAAHTHTIFIKQPDGNLADAKYEMDGSRYQGGWCQPQNDGPASRAIILMRFAKRYEELHPGDNYVSTDLYSTSLDQNVKNPIKRDLEYLYNFWDQENCEPWEEIRGKHFYDRIVARRAFVMGAEFAQARGDTDAANRYRSRIADTEAKINGHWKPGQNLIQPEENNVANRLEDVQSILAMMHSYSQHDGYFRARDSRSLANALFTIEKFQGYWPINKLGWQNELDLGPAIGRYTGDVYSGTEACPLPQEVCPEPCGGQAWFLATNGVAEFLYRVAVEFIEVGKIDIDNTNRPFFVHIGGAQILESGSSFAKDTPEFNMLITLLIHAGDSFMKRTKFHTDTTFRMDEQYNGVTGAQMSAGDLTWAYASLVTATDTRNRLNPRQLLASYTLDDQVQVEFVVSKVQSTVSNMVVVGNTESTGNGDPCKGIKLFKRRTVGSRSEFSAFVNLPKETNIELRPVILSSAGACASGQIADNPVTFTTGKYNPLNAAFATFCTGNCEPVKPDDPVEITFEVSGVPGDLNTVAIVGSLPVLGKSTSEEYWEPCDGLRLTNSGGKWTGKLNIKAKDAFRFKAVGLTNENRAEQCGVVWEGGGDTPAGPFTEASEVIVHTFQQGV